MKNSLLSGVNKKCYDCTEVCKQYKHVVVMYCPNWKAKYVRKKTGNERSFKE